MKRNLKVEAEGSELVLKNKAGDYVIIPKDKRASVQDMLSRKCNSCIDSLVETLPTMANYAVDGTVMPSEDPGPKPKITRQFSVTDKGSNRQQAVMPSQPTLPKVMDALDSTMKLGGIGNALMAETYAGLTGQNYDFRNAIDITPTSKGGKQRSLSQTTGTSGVTGFLLDVADPALAAGLVTGGIKAGAKGLSKFAAKNAAEELPKITQNVAKKITGVPEETALVKQLREELSEKGIVSSQKTPNFPWKDPIRKAVDPFGYNLKEKISDIKGLILNKKNPNYTSEKDIDDLYNEYLRSSGFGEGLGKPPSNPVSKEHYIAEFVNPKDLFKTEKEYILNRFNTRFKNKTTSFNFFNDTQSKNRHATWDMYLGKPQKEHPLYDISALTTSKDDVVYTIKPDFMRKDQLELNFKNTIDELEKPEMSRDEFFSSKLSKQGDSWLLSDSDRYFGTMGGFHWKIDKLPDGNYKMIANDVWDLQPFKNVKKGASSNRFYNPDTTGYNFLNNYFSI